MRTLLLMRHAKSDWAQLGLTDFDRPLNDRGQKAARRMGLWMKEARVQPDWVICSSACRAQQTLDGLREPLSMPDTQIQHEARAYLAAPDTLLSLLADCPHDKAHVLLIGHNPGLEELLTHLCGNTVPLSKTGKLMPTATLAQIALDDDWHHLDSGSGRLIEIVRPREL